MHTVIANQSALLKNLPNEVIVFILTSLTLVLANVSSSWVAAAIVLPIAAELVSIIIVLKYLP